MSCSRIACSLRGWEGDGTYACKLLSLRRHFCDGIKARTTWNDTNSSPCWPFERRTYSNLAWTWTTTRRSSLLRVIITLGHWLHEQSVVACSLLRLGADGSTQRQCPAIFKPSCPSQASSTMGAAGSREHPHLRSRRSKKNKGAAMRMTSIICSPSFPLSHLLTA